MTLEELWADDYFVWRHEHCLLSTEELRIMARIIREAAKAKQQGIARKPRGPSPLTRAVRALGAGDLPGLVAMLRDEELIEDLYHRTPKPAIDIHCIEVDDDREIVTFQARGRNKKETVRFRWLNNLLTRQPAGA